jgi:hypothetical protein
MNLFKKFEITGMSVDDDWHLYVLHYLFLPRIQEELNEFKNAWNNHQVSTERNETPLQMLVTREDDYPPLLVRDDDENYGVDFDENPNVDDGRNHCVECDPIFCPLSPVNLAIFKARVKPLTLDTTPEDCENWFFTTIKYILEIKEQQIE